MATNTKTLFPKNKQARSQNTLNDLLEAANQLITNADSKQFTARSLAQKSGYALGTLIARLKSVEKNIFKRLFKVLKILIGIKAFKNWGNY